MRAFFTSDMHFAKFKNTRHRYYYFQWLQRYNRWFLKNIPKLIQGDFK